MTAVTQTDAFNKLDESTLKDFIAKVRSYKIRKNFSSLVSNMVNFRFIRTGSEPYLYKNHTYIVSYHRKF